jgi:hypothetical protein
MSDLLDHIVGDSQQFIWNSETERLRGLEIDHQLEPKAVPGLFESVGFPAGSE